MRPEPIADCLFLPGGQPSAASRQLYRNPEHSSEKRCKTFGVGLFFILILGTSTAIAQADCTGAPQWEWPTIYDIVARVVFGLPASTAAAGSGFTTVQAAQNAVRYLTRRTKYAGRSYTFQKPTGAYPDFRGLMTWNVFHDAANNFEFSANHGPFLRNLP